MKLKSFYLTMLTLKHWQKVFPMSDAKELIEDFSQPSGSQKRKAPEASVQRPEDLC